MIEYLIFAFLIVFALAAVIASNLKMAIIIRGVFGLFSAFVYLLYHAPDVALAEAVIASTLGTILFILTIKKYNDITVHPTGTRLWKSFLAFVIIVATFGLTMHLHFKTEPLAPPVLFESIMDVFFSYGRITNPIASILLNFRMFDTMFEALILLLSVMIVVHFIKDRDPGGANHDE